MAELLYFEKPSLLIPLPHGQSREQEHNAYFLKHLHLAEVVLQKDAQTKFLNVLNDMLGNITRYKLSETSQKELLTNASERIVAIVLDVGKQKTNKKS